MTARVIIVAATVLAIALTGAGCAPSSPVPAAHPIPPASEQTVPAQTATVTTPGSWIPSSRGPWDGALYQAASKDGISFGTSTLVLKQAGVPNLLRTKDGRIILTYQYFSSEDRSLFDAIAYSASEDDGKTWTTPKALALSGVPTPIDADKRPMDPTLVQLEDGSLRLYFTYHAAGRKHAELYSATNAVGDIGGTFAVSAAPALTIDETNLLDPTVVLLGGTWHHFSWQDGSDDNFHSTSSDGLEFIRQADVSLPMDFLGQAISTGSSIRMYGTGEGGVVSAMSSDGFSWKMDSGSRMQGADPGVAVLADGTYLMVYSKMNFN